MGLAAVLALAAVAVPRIVGPRSGTVGNEDTSGASAMTEPASAPLVSGRIWNFKFDYPAAWALHDGGTASVDGEPGNNALGTLGPVSEACDAYGTYVGNKPAACIATWSLAPGSAAMMFEWLTVNEPSGYRPWSLMRAESAPPAGPQLVTVAGVRAIYARNLTNRVPISSTVAGDAAIPAADEVLTWELVDRFNGFNGFKITVAIRGPNTAALEAQVMAVIASMHYLPAIVPLATDEASKAAALKEFFAVTPPARLTCFSSSLGVTETATVTRIGVVDLSKPLPVRCTVTVEAEPEQVWQVTLTWEWDAAPDHIAGKATEIWHNSPTWDGAAIDVSGVENMPYALPNTGNG